MTTISALPIKYLILGTGISATTYDEVIQIVTRPTTERATVVAVCNVHSIMQARRDRTLRTALESADITTPDGMPLVWALRRMFVPDQQRVYGPELMRRALKTTQLRHYLYGGSEETLSKLEAMLEMSWPQARIVGSKSPPFRELSDQELSDDVRGIMQTGATIVWVGLGMPKQELWMQRVASRLPGISLVGVGAAFDFLAGTIEEAPDWMQRSGLAWLFRLAQEPRRLWRRYVWNNPLFLVLLSWQLVRGRFNRLRVTQRTSL